MHSRLTYSIVNLLLVLSAWMAFIKEDGHPVLMLSLLGSSDAK